MERSFKEQMKGYADMEWKGILFFFSVMGYAMLFLMALPKLKMGQALLCAVCSMLFAAYYGVIIAGWMAPVAYLLMFGGLAGLLAGLVCGVINRRNLRARLCSPGLLVFGLLLVYLLYGAQGICIQDHDAMSYWARAVKELYTFDRFYIHGDATMFHRDYIPLLASLQYCVVRVFGWQDAYLSFVTAACIAASVAAVAESFHKRWSAVAVAVLLVYAYRLYGFGLYDLRADGPMLMVFTAGVVCLLDRRDDSFSSLCPVLLCSAVLTGFKIYSGLMFAIVLVAGLVMEWISAAHQKRPARTLAMVTALSAVLIIALQLSWSILYNYTSAMAVAQETAAIAAYRGEAAGSVGASVSLGRLLSGNPRTSRLMHSFTPENIETFLRLAGQTVSMYASSKLVWTGLFLLPVIILALGATHEKRMLAIKMILLLLAAALIYLMGLFGSYFVQSETSGAATVYLATASTPLVIAAVYLMARMGCAHARTLPAVLLAAMAGGMMLLTPPDCLVPKTEKDEFAFESALAVDYYENEINGLLTEADAGKRALLIDSSYQATLVNGDSGKTHAYAYFGLPVRVLEPVYYVYGDYTQLETFDAEWLRQRLIDGRCELLMVRVEDFLYWEEISDALGLYGENDSSIGVYDVTYADGELSFAFRLPPEES